MFAILSLLLTLTLSLLVTRVAAMALMLTGLSREAAKFQARSAFSGVGFTTGESESLVNHPVRRRIVMILMLLGNLGVATVVATVLASIMQVRNADDQWLMLGVLVAGLAALWVIATSRWVERRLNRLISWTLRTFARLEVRDYVAVLHLQDGYAVTELMIEPQDWLSDRTLAETRLSSEGVLMLGIHKPDGTWLGTPTGETRLHAGDTAVLYGPIHRLAELDERRAGREGDIAHVQARAETAVLIQQEHEHELEQQDHESAR